MWLARADCLKLIKKKKWYSDIKKKKLLKKQKHIGLCRVSIHVVFVKWDDIKNKKGKNILASM